MHTNKIQPPFRSPALTVFFVSTIAAALTHLYLFKEHLKLKYTSEPVGSLCQISDFLNCSASIGGSYSEVFGVPLAILGLFAQVIILFYALKAFVFKKDSSLTLVWLLSLFCALVSIVMLGISLFLVKSLCPFCTLTYIFSFVSLASLWWLGAHRQLKLGPSAAKGLLISGAAIVILSFITQAIAAQRHQGREVTEMLELVVQDWKSKPSVVIEPVAPIQSGSPDAPMVIVEFADFLCSHCKTAYPKLKSFLKSEPRAQLLFQAYPLDGCAGPANAPGRQCELAIAAYCGSLQNKGEATAEYLFDSQNLMAQTTDFEKELSSMAQFLQIKEDTFKACMKDAQSLEMIKKQIALGKKLEIKGTPTLFINGRLFQGPPEMPLLKRVAQEIKN